MAELIELHTDGPHSPEYTHQVAELVAEGIRVLNYATKPCADGLEYPGDVYTLLGSLYTATERMPQLLDQIGAFLRLHMLDDRLADNHGRNPALQAGMAADLLEDCRMRFPGITTHLQRAQGDIAGLYVKERGSGSDAE